MARSKRRQKRMVGKPKLTPETECLRHTYYHTRSEAEVARMRYNAAHLEDPIETYPCEHCNGFHNGHPPTQLYE